MLQSEYLILGAENVLAPSADKQTCNYDTECSNHHPPQFPEGTGIEPEQDKIVIYICVNIPGNVIVRLPHPRI